jgi:hypothetical protein
MASCRKFENVYILIRLWFRLQEGKLMRQAAPQHWQKVFKNSHYCTACLFLSLHHNYYCQHVHIDFAHGHYLNTNTAAAEDATQNIITC